jgi:hypothetical protein
MSKIKTEDCVEFLVKHIPTSHKDDWKRRSKFNWQNGVKRIFENTVTGIYWSVYEKDGTFIEFAVVGPDDVMFKKPVAPIYYIIHESEGFIGLTVTDSKEFDTHNRASDWTPKGTFEELKRLGYPGCEDMEGVVEFLNEVTDIEDLKAKLASSPVFKFSPAFQKFMQDYESEEMKIILI